MEGGDKDCPKKKTDVIFAFRQDWRILRSEDTEVFYDRPIRMRPIW